MPLGRLGRGDVRAWLTRLAVDGRGAGIIGQTLRTLRTVLSVAVDAELIAANVATRIAAPKTVASAAREERRALSPDEIATLVDATPVRYRALTALASWTGLRIGELAGLRRQDLDLLRLDVRVVGQLQRHHGRYFTAEERAAGPHLTEPKTDAALRTVPVPASLRPLLEEHLARYVRPDAGAMIFTSPTGRPLAVGNWRARVFVPALRKAGLDHLVPHALRATFTTHLVAAGVDVKTAQELLGHGSPTVTLTAYARVRPEAVEGARLKLDVLASGARVTPSAPVLVLDGNLARATGVRSKPRNST